MKARTSGSLDIVTSTLILTKGLPMEELPVGGVKRPHNFFPTTNAGTPGWASLSTMSQFHTDFKGTVSPSKAKATLFKPVPYSIRRVRLHSGSGLESLVLNDQ